MPVPAVPLVIVIHDAWLTAVQEQLVPVTTDSAPLVVPAAGYDALVDERL